MRSATRWDIGDGIRLAADEEVNEVLRPMPLLYAWRDFAALVLGLVFLWLVYSVLVVAIQASGPGPSWPDLIVISVVTLPFLAIGILLVLRPPLLIFRAHTTRYILTSHRLIESFRWWGRPFIRDIAWSHVYLQSTRRFTAGIGDVLICIRGKSAYRWRRARGLLAVRDVQRIEQLVRSLTDPAGAGTPSRP